MKTPERRLVRRVGSKLAPLLCIAVLQSVLLAGTVILDTSFNGTGYRIQNFSPDGSIGNSVAIQQDGRIVLGGFTLGLAFYDKFAAMRLNPNGTLDTGFDTDGFVITTVANFDRGDTTLIQPDGKILLGGERYFGESNNDFTILRYNPDGTLDNTFDGNGVASPAQNGFSDDHGYDMALQPDGKIVMVGSTDLATTINQNLPTDISIMRFNTNGSVDTTLAGGYLVIRFDGVSESANAIAIQPDGKYVLGGFVNFTGSDDFLVIRLNPNGTLDTSFGTGGFTITPVTGGNDGIVSLVLQSDGKIVAGGAHSVARYTAGGVLDSTFGSNGIAAVPHTVKKIVKLAGDKVLAVGTTGPSVAVSRWNPNGTPDLTFNRTGSAIVTVPGNSCDGASAAVQSDNRIVIGGSCTSNGQTRFAVIRLKETEAKAPFDFDGDGKTDVGIFRPAAGEWWYSRSGDGQVAAFQFGSPADRIAPADFTGDGKADAAFFRASTGQWYILRSEDFSFLALPFGADGDVPVPADYDADGRADVAVFRPSSSTWYILQSSGGTRINPFGATGDVPVPADYDGDAKADIAIFRPLAGEWWVSRSTAGLVALQFGTSADKPVQGDYTGDGRADIAFWRPATGQWNILRSEDFSYLAFPFGSSGDVPAPGDYDGDGRFDAAVFRPSQATWYINRSTAGVAIQQFGTAGDRPIPNAFVP